MELTRTLFPKCQTAMTSSYVDDGDPLRLGVLGTARRGGLLAPPAGRTIRVPRVASVLPAAGIERTELVGLIALTELVLHLLDSLNLVGIWGVLDLLTTLNLLINLLMSVLNLMKCLNSLDVLHLWSFVDPSLTIVRALDSLNFLSL